MTETKIKGLKVLLDDDYIEIVDAHQINNKEKMKDFITEACDKMDFCIIKRTMDSMVRQWAFTNRMYRWHILKKKHSKCIITNKINWFKTMIYFLLGFQQIRFAKIKKRLEKTKMSDVTLGTLYDVNKQIIQQLPPYNRENFADSILLINSYAEKSANKYYMLLCNDIKYFTLFVREQCMKTETIGEAAIDCSQYLGEVKSINYNDNESAIEIWFVSTIDQEAHVAYFFAYDEGVISCV
jgi:hypothetical protein